MSLRGMAAKVAVVGTLATAVLAATAVPASATANAASCAAAWDVVDAAQEAMGLTSSDEEFWFYHRIWASELSWISAYC